MDERDPDGRMADREERRRIRRAQEARANGGAPPPEAAAAGTDTEYTYRDPGRFGAPGYSYQVGDEMSNPGPEPPRDDPRWPEWKNAARAWRNFIGGRQRYVDENVGIYGEGALEAMGIRDVKEEGRAGYRRIMAPGMIDKLRGRQAEWMKGSDAEIDPETGLYMTGGGDTAAYYDSYGRQVDARGNPTGGAYGQGHMQATFGAGAGPLNVGNQGYQAVRPGTPGAGRGAAHPAAGPGAPQMQYGPGWKAATETSRTPSAAWGGYNPVASAGTARPTTPTPTPAPTPGQDQYKSASALGAPGVPGGRPRPNNYGGVRGGQISTGLPRF